MDEQFKQRFQEIGEAIDKIADLIRNLARSYEDASLRALQSEEARMVAVEAAQKEKESRIATEEKNLTLLQEASVQAAKFAATVERLADTEEEKEEARKAAKAAETKAREVGAAFEQIREELAQSRSEIEAQRAASEEYKRSKEEEDKKEREERDGVLEALTSVRDSLFALAGNSGYGGEQ